MPAFDRFHRLGEEQFRKIMNALMRGEAALHLARQMQAPPPAGWGVFQDVQEGTLTAMLNRLRQDMARGVFGIKSVHHIKHGHLPQIKLLEKVSTQVLERMETLSDIQKDRVLGLVEREKALETKTPWSVVRVASDTINDTIKEYRELLTNIQKIRFDMGLDEYKGPIGGGFAALRSATHTTTNPDGSSVQKQVFEAVSAVEHIFNQRKIPQLVEKE